MKQAFSTLIFWIGFLLILLQNPMPKFLKVVGIIFIIIGILTDKHISPKIHAFFNKKKQ